MTLTSVDAQLQLGNLRIGKCRNFSFSIEKEPLDTTRLGDLDRTYIPGIRGSSGVFTLFYDPRDQGVVSIVNNILSDSGTSLSNFTLVYDKNTKRKTTVSIVITQVTAGTEFGSAQTCEVTFRATGRIQGAF
jgi:hypothetical protein